LEMYPPMAENHDIIQTTQVSMQHPRRFDQFPFLGFVKVDISPPQDALGKQTVKIQTSEDVSFQSNIPLHPRPFDPSGTFFEIDVRALKPGAVLAIGFASTPYPPFRLPGWDPNSVAVHSDDGAKFMNVYPPNAGSRFRDAVYAPVRDR
jgi:hypothetical protein